MTDLINYEHDFIVIGGANYTAGTPLDSFYLNPSLDDVFINQWAPSWDAQYIFSGTAGAEADPGSPRVLRTNAQPNPSAFTLPAGLSNTVAFARLMQTGRVRYTFYGSADPLLFNFVTGPTVSLSYFDSTDFNEIITNPVPIPNTYLGISPRIYCDGAAASIILSMAYSDPFNTITVRSLTFRFSLSDLSLSTMSINLDVNMANRSIYIYCSGGAGRSYYESIGSWSGPGFNVFNEGFLGGSAYGVFGFIDNYLNYPTGILSALAVPVWTLNSADSAPWGDRATIQYLSFELSTQSSLGSGMKIGAL